MIRRVMHLHRYRGYNDFAKLSANFVPLTPLSFLKHAATTSPDHNCYVNCNEDGTSIVKRDWKTVSLRCSSFASMLNTEFNVKNNNDVVAILAFNGPAIFESHFSVPGAGAILLTLNIRLDANAIAQQLIHSSPKVLIYDVEFKSLVEEALKTVSLAYVHVPKLIQLNELDLNVCEYEALLQRHSLSTFSDFEFFYPLDEFHAIALNYTSGTTASPKGVVLHHRGAYLNALGNAVEFPLSKHPQYLFVQPLFHCNGWCYAWTMAAKCGCSFFLRQVSIYKIL